MVRIDPSSYVLLWKVNFSGHANCNGASGANTAPMEFGICQGISRMDLCLSACGIQTTKCLEAVLGRGVISMPGVQINAHWVWRASSPVWLSKIRVKPSWTSDLRQNFYKWWGDIRSDGALWYHLGLIFEIFLYPNHHSQVIVHKV